MRKTAWAVSGTVADRFAWLMETRSDEPVDADRAIFPESSDAVKTGRAMQALDDSGDLPGVSALPWLASDVEPVRPYSAHFDWRHGTFRLVQRMVA